MNALKHMEAIFVAIAAVALGIAFATTEPKALDVAADSGIVAKAEVNMPVVVVAAKRLSAAEKAALI